MPWTANGKAKQGRFAPFVVRPAAGRRAGSDAVPLTITRVIGRGTVRPLKERSYPRAQAGAARPQQLLWGLEGILPARKPVFRSAEMHGRVADRRFATRPSSHDGEGAACGERRYRFTTAYYLVFFAPLFARLHIRYLKHGSIL